MPLIMHGVLILHGKKDVLMKKTSIIVIVILTLAIVSFIGADMIMKWHESELNTSEAQLQENFDQKVKGLEDHIQHLEEALANERNIYPSAERLEDAFGRDVTDLILSDSPLSLEECASIKESILSFFYYLDNSGYSDRYNLKEGTHHYYQQTLKTLSQNPPHFAGESAEILTLLRSMSHFSRVLGRKGTLILKDILENETDMLEPAMALIFRLIEQDKACKDTVEAPPLATTYEYAYFFLNTLSGKSYLMRRNSKLRILANYYALRIIRLAETRGMNSYGLDPRAHAVLLMNDMENHRGLLYKPSYMDHLQQIIESTPSPLIPGQEKSNE
jgi:hypothetical protein